MALNAVRLRPLLVAAAFGGLGDRQLLTRWASEVVERGDVLPEYPRPAMVRPRFLGLNGPWEYAVTPGAAAAPQQYQGTILVPFAIETHLSGVGRRLGPEERLWYRRTFEIQADWLRGGQRVLLHFGAVDFEAEVWLNGIRLGSHRGGYDAFSFDLSEHLRREGAQELVVAVRDPTDTGGQSRGKQVREPRGIWYTPTSGIWQTVWIEPVPAAAIESLDVAADAVSGRLTVTVEAPRAPAGARLIVEVEGDGRTFASPPAPLPAASVQIVPLRRWSPDDPFLYTVRVRLTGPDRATLDSIESYAGFRLIAVGPGGGRTPRIMLNAEASFQIGMLDQGYWPDGGLTAPTDAALRSDIEMARAMGFNLLRKHVKVEPQRWYYWCDRLGMLVWQDMPSGDNRTDEDRRQFRAELEEMVRERGHHPSIIAWVPFNEGWGQHDTESVAAWLKERDPTRLVNEASGWHHHGAGDLIDIHDYPGPAGIAPQPGRAAVLGEFGGLGLRIDGHMWVDDGWGYALLHDREELARRYEDLMRAARRLRDDPGISAVVYTQVSDVESESNGLLTYDRAVAKIPPERVRLANLAYTPPVLASDSELFVTTATVRLECERDGAEIRCTLDGSEPGPAARRYTGPFEVDASCDLVARATWADGTQSYPARYRLERVTPRAALGAAGGSAGLAYSVYAGRWSQLPDFAALEPLASGRTTTIDHTPAGPTDEFAIVFEGYLSVPQTGVYRLGTTSDDGSRLFIGGERIIDNDGLHGPRTIEGSVALAAGAHRIRIEMFEAAGGETLAITIAGPGLEAQALPASLLSCD